METANLAGRSEPGTLIRGRHHLWSLATGSERKSGGLRRWASGRLNWLNATIWKGIKTPERERRSVGHSGASDWSGFGEGPVGYEGSRPGAFDLEMGARKRVLVAGERKVASEYRLRLGTA